MEMLISTIRLDGILRINHESHDAL